MKYKQKLEGMTECPWCKSFDLVVENFELLFVTVMCSDCGAMGPPVWVQDAQYGTEDQNCRSAVKAWNARTEF